LDFWRSRRKIWIAVALGAVLLLARIGAFGQSVTTDSFGFFDSAASSVILTRAGGDSFTFAESASGVIQVLRAIQDGFATFDSAVGTIVLSRGLGDSYIFSGNLSLFLSLPRNLSDLFHFSDSAARRAAFLRDEGSSYAFRDSATIAVVMLGVQSCTTQLAVSHLCSLVGSPGNDKFPIDTCELSGDVCLLSGNYTVTAVAHGTPDLFNITNGPGSNRYSIDAGSGNATFYVDACDGASPSNFSLSFQAGLCTSDLLPATASNSYSLLGGGNAESPNSFVILDGPGNNIYSMTGGEGPDNYTIYGGEDNDSYAIIGGAGSSVQAVGGNGTEVYSIICGSDSSLNITSGIGPEEFGIIAGDNSSVKISGTSALDVYNIVF